MDPIYARDVGGHRKLKIAFVCPDDLSTTIFCRGLVNAIRDLKEFEVCTASTYLDEFDNYKKEIMSWGHDHINLPMYRYFNPLKDLRYCIALFQFYRKRKIDIAVHWTTKPNIYGVLAAKLAGVEKTMIAIRGLGSVFQKENSFKGKILRLVVLNLYRIAGKLSNVIWFTNTNDLNYFVSRGIAHPKKTLLTKNGIDIKHYSLDSIRECSLNSLRKEFGLKADDKIVVMVARMIWPKGIKEFAEAAEILGKRHTNVVFILVAPLERDSSLSCPEVFIEAKQKMKNFRWCGFRKDVREIYALSDIAVLPSYYKEGGYPRALLEPMTMAKPVIAADTPDCRGPVEEGKNGYLVPIKDPQSLADAIEKLIVDQNKRKEFGNYSRVKVLREFDEQLVIKEIIGKITQLGHAIRSDRNRF